MPIVELVLERTEIFLLKSSVDEAFTYGRINLLGEMLEVLCSERPASLSALNS